MKIDIRNISYNDFLDFLFYHPPTSNIKKEEPWYLDFDLEVVYDPDENLERFMRLFTSPEELLKKYSKDALEQGFLAIQSVNLPGAIPDLLDNKSLPVEKKIRLIKSMYFLFEKLFVKEPLETSSHMWWDSFCFDFDMSEGVPKNPDEKLIQDSMFECLKKILRLPSYDCRISSLHGLGHFKHPETKGVVETFLSQEQNITDEMKKWAKAAIEGKVL